MKRNDRRPTNAELAILGAIWRLGPSPVRAVHDLMISDGDRKIGYTTVLKLMQIMNDKGLLKRDTSVRPQVYEPARSQKHTQRQLLGDLMDKVFGGSSSSLVLQALSSKKTTPEDRRTIRELLDTLEAER